MGITLAKAWDVLLVMQQHAFTALKWFLLGMGALAVLGIAVGVVVGKYFARPGISDTEGDK